MGGIIMSWNPIEMDDISLTFEAGPLTRIFWICPRCNGEQIVDLDLPLLVHGIEIVCQNVNVCGERQVYFELQLSITYSGQQGLSDRPLIAEN